MEFSKAMAMLAIAAVVLVVPALASDAGTLDDGQLDPEWFGGSPSFRETKHLDYVWVKDGFKVTGKTIVLAAWEPHEFLGEQRDARDAKDAALADRLTASMPAMIRRALKTSVNGVAIVAPGAADPGDLAITGRIVDCNAGNTGAKLFVGMGAGSASVTWDMKIVDMATGELLVAIHHRSVSGTMYSTIDTKLTKWAAEFGKAMEADLAEYAKGRPRKN